MVMDKLDPVMKKATETLASLEKAYSTSAITAGRGTARHAGGGAGWRSSGISARTSTNERLRRRPARVARDKSRR